MNIEYGTWIAIAAVLIFYLRLIILQRHKARANVRKGARRKSAQASSPTSALSVNKPSTAVGAVLVLAGAVLAGFPALDAFSGWWWLPFTLGILVMGLGIR